MEDRLSADGGQESGDGALGDRSQGGAGVQVLATRVGEHLLRLNSISETGVSHPGDVHAAA
jgi:hypothetical protein